MVPLGVTISPPWSPIDYARGMTTPTGFTRRPRGALLRGHVDLPEDEAAEIAAIAEAESVRTREKVGVQVVLRRMIRMGVVRWKMGER